MFGNLSSICTLPDSCQNRKKKRTQRDYLGFKESREAAINVIPTLGLDVNEMGDHIPNPKTHSHYTKLFFQLSPKRKKGTNCGKVQHRYRAINSEEHSVYREHARACSTILDNDLYPSPVSQQVEVHMHTGQR